MVRQKQFQGAYVSGAALSASAGLPDTGILSLDQFCSKIREIADATNRGDDGDPLPHTPFPLLCDADTGFGEGTDIIYRTIYDYSHAGAAACHLDGRFGFR